VRRRQLAEEIEEVFHGSGGTYGSPKVFIELVRRGWRVSVNTVAKVMAELGLAGRKVRSRRSLTRPGKRPAAADFVRRDFTAEEPDLVWAGDLTEIETSEGKLYLATVIDLFSLRLLGYAMAARHDADLVVASLNMAAATRGGDVRGVIMHTGQRVLLTTVQAGLPKARHRPVHGQSRILFRQRRERGVQQRAKGRVRPPACLPDPHRGPHQDRHLDHRLLQRQKATQRVRVQEPDRLRT
jgi:transposase InsO family protein